MTKTFTKRQHLEIDYRNVQKDLKTAQGQRYGELLKLKNLIFKELMEISN